METRQSTHPSPQQLAAFAFDKLTSDGSERLRKHVSTCSSCKAFLSQTPRETLRSLLQQSSLPRSNAEQPTSSGQRQRDTHPASAKAPLSKLPQAKPLQPRPSSASQTPRPVLPLAESNDDWIPQALREQTKYRIVRLLGRGGMGSVYEVHHERMDRRQALKVINPELVDNPQALSRFDKEVQAVAKLDHPNIARAYDAESFGTLQAIVMEFVPGRSLDAVLKKRGRLSVPEACRYIAQACLGLQHAHERGLVHRDLKPQNLMLDEDSGAIKILDFGLAKIVSENKCSHGLTMTNMTMGTYEYSAPEQALDAASADIRADIYSLGCTLYYLIAGVLPFDYNSDAKLLMAHQNEKPRPLGEICPETPAELSRLVARMLAKKPADRPQTPVEVANALLPFAQAEIVASADQAKTLDTAPAAGLELNNLLEEVQQGTGRKRSQTMVQTSSSRLRTGTRAGRKGSSGSVVALAARRLDGLLRRAVGEDNNVLRYFLWAAIPLSCLAAAVGIWVWGAAPAPKQSQQLAAKTTPPDNSKTPKSAVAGSPGRADSAGANQVRRPAPTEMDVVSLPEEKSQVPPQSVEPPKPANQDPKPRTAPVPETEEAGSPSPEAAREASVEKPAAPTSDPSDAQDTPQAKAPASPLVTNVPGQARTAGKGPASAGAAAPPAGKAKNASEDSVEARLDAMKAGHQNWSHQVVEKVPVVVDEKGMRTQFGSSRADTTHNLYRSTVRKLVMEPLKGQLVSYEKDEVTIQTADGPTKLKYGNFSKPDQKFLDDYRKLERQSSAK